MIQWSTEDLIYAVVSTRSHAPVRLKSLSSSKDPACTVEQHREAGSKGRVEVVTGPRNMVVSIKYVWIRVMPRPEQQLNTHYIKRYVQ